MEQSTIAHIYLLSRCQNAYSCNGYMSSHIVLVYGGGMLAYQAAGVGEWPDRSGYFILTTVLDSIMASDCTITGLANTGTIPSHNTTA